MFIHYVFSTHQGGFMSKFDFNKKHISRLLCAVLLILSFSLVSARCASDVDATVVFADGPKNHVFSQDSMDFLKKMQQANRELASAVLPSVVTVDVVETRKVRDPFGGMPFQFFFGRPEGDDENSDSGTREYKTQGLGSGFVVKKVGKTYYALTNQHVAGKASEISVKLYNKQEVKAKLVGADSRRDIALVSFDSDEDIPIAKLGNSDEVEVGDIAFAIGSPMGFVSSVTQGMISAVGRHGGPNSNINDFIQTDAAINQGNSGGPLVNIYGEVIGVNTWIASSSGGSQGLGFSIPINNVKKAIEDFIQFGEIKSGWLGVQLSSVDKDFLKSLGVEQTEGALASQLFLGSPADKAGMMAGDFIVELNGKPVKSVDKLVLDVGDLLAGEDATFKVIRDKREVILHAKIEARDEKLVGDSSRLWPGFAPIPLTDEIIEKLNLAKGQEGVIITSLLAKSPAVIMGLKQSDIVVGICDKKVRNIGEFYRELAEPRSEVWFDIVREGQRFSTVRFKKK